MLKQPTSPRPPFGYAPLPPSSADGWRIVGLLAWLPSGALWAAALLLLGLTALGIYGLRGVYFSLTAQAGLPLAVTGAAVGWVSFWGFTPDILAGPLYGAVLDAYPGALGHRLLNAGIALLGLCGAWCSWCWRRAQPTLASTAMRP